MNVLLLAVVLCGQAESVEDSAKQTDESHWSVLAREHVEGYSLTPAAEGSDSKYTRVEQPVSQHVQNVTGSAVGSVYIWKDQTGRPVAICDVFFLLGSTGYHLSDEWHSLTSDSMRARRDDGIRWQPAEPGLFWKEIPEAPVPGDSPERRLLQLRQLSRRFTGHVIDKKQARYELRMLTTPIYQYEVQGGESLSGGLFAFCQTNDPEMLLVIEARKVKDGYRWMYSPAEFSNLDQYLVLDGTEVWKAAPPTFSYTGRHLGGPIRQVDIKLDKRE